MCPYSSFKPREYYRWRSSYDFLVKVFLEKAMEREKAFDEKEDCEKEHEKHSGIKETQCADDFVDKVSCEHTEDISEIQEIKDIGVGKKQEISEEENFDCGEEIAILNEWNI